MVHRLVLAILGVLFAFNVQAKELVQNYELVLRDVHARAHHLGMRDVIRVGAQASLCIYEDHRDLCTNRAPLEAWLGHDAGYTEELRVYPNTIYSDTLRMQVDVMWVANGLVNLFPSMSARNAGESVEGYYERLRKDPQAEKNLHRPFLKVEFESLPGPNNTGQALGEAIYGLDADLLGWASAGRLRIRSNYATSQVDNIHYWFTVELWSLGNYQEMPVFAPLAVRQTRPACVEYQTSTVQGEPRFAVVDSYGYRRLGTFKTAADAWRFIQSQPSCEIQPPYGSK